MENILQMDAHINKGGETENHLENILLRLVAVLQEENKHLESGEGVNHATYIVSKNQVLRELMAVQRTIQINALPPDIVRQLRMTRTLVDRNHQLLKMQVSALNEVTSFLTQAAILEQGDGTYTRERQ
jgi:uncharacterized protein with PIN domain